MNPDAVRRLREWLEEKELDRIFLYRPENFAWVTGGADNTVVSGEPVASLEVDRRDVIVHASSIEERRFAEEQTPGLRIDPYPWWHEPPAGTPNDLEYDLTMLRLVLSEPEICAFRHLGEDVSAVTGSIVRAATPHWTERALAGAVGEALMGLGIRPTALLVAGEERMFKHRHPLPTPAPLRRACMVVVCAQRHGLTANLTRTRSWDHPETSSLHDEVLEVESKALEATRPGHTLAGVIAAVRRAYSTLGRPDAFEQHHQGGIAGYRSREVLATPGSTVELKVGMAVAWNPSLPGAKAEDTFLLGKRGLENLTFDPDWPIERVHGRDRPALLLS